MVRWRAKNGLSSEKIEEKPLRSKEKHPCFSSPLWIYLLTSMRTAAEALQTILESIVPVTSEQCELSSLYDRVLAADVAAPHDVPLFDNASMDGYAIRSHDVASAQGSANVPLTLQGKVQAGVEYQKDLSPFHAIRIMTGAPVPGGADAVIEQELVTARNGSVSVAAPVDSGRNIRKRGEDVKAWTVVVRKGTRLKSAHVGVLASLGIVKADVYRKPRIGFLTTGDELIGAQETPLPGQIRNSNAYTLRGMIGEAGCEPTDLGSVPDDKEELKKRINEGLAFDALITSGGVSVGEHDLVLGILKSLAVEILFWKVNIKPGMPMAFGVSKTGVPVFALPGNPVSTMVTFLRFVRPGLEKRGGVAGPGNEIRLKATLADPLRKKDSKRHFIRGVLGNERGGLVVHTTGSQSSGVLTSLTKANCLIILPEESEGVNAGEEVEIELI